MTKCCLSCLTSIIVWVSNKTLLLVFDILLRGVWLSFETLFRVLIIASLCLGISLDITFWCLPGDIRWNNAACRVWQESVFGYHMKQSLSCHMNYSIWYYFVVLIRVEIRKIKRKFTILTALCVITDAPFAFWTYFRYLSLQGHISYDIADKAVDFLQANK